MANNSNKLNILVVLITFFVVGNLMAFFIIFDESPSTPSPTIKTGSEDNLKEGVISKFLNKQKEIVYYVDPLSRGADREALDSLREAMDFWEDNENVIFTGTFSESNSDLKVYWAKDFGGEHIGYSYVDLIEIGLGSSDCLDQWHQFSDDTLFLLSAHEIGHFLGYDHSEDERAVMYHELEIKLKEDIDKADILPEGYIQFYPFCSAKELTEYSIKITSDESINVYVVKSKEDYDLFIEREEFYHYVECSEEKTKRYEKDCVVPEGAGIVIESSMLGTVEYKIVVKEL